VTNRSSQSSGNHSRVGARWWRLTALVFALAAGVLAMSACSGSSQNPSESTVSSAAQDASQSAESSSAAATATAAATSTGSASTAPTKPAPGATKLQIKDIKVGKGAVAKAGDTVTVDYTGWLMDGTKFDSSVDRHQPFQFVLGNGDVIAGWDQGVAGMKVGGTRQLIIPPSLGYGAEGASGVIPANATLKFEVKLLAVQAGQ
jgi:FKBP-type peptidyl-prolyl cis-trans isomerase